MSGLGGLIRSVGAMQWGPVKRSPFERRRRAGIAGYRRAWKRILRPTTRPVEHMHSAARRRALAAMSPEWSPGSPEQMLGRSKRVRS